MNSRERVVTALNHLEPDRVPFDCQLGYDAYIRLSHYLGYKGHEDISTNTDLTVRPQIDFLRELGVDLYYVGLQAGSNQAEFEYGMDEYIDEWGVRYEKIFGNFGFSYEAVEPPLSRFSTNELDDYPWPDPFDPKRVLGLYERCEYLSNKTEFAIVGKFSTSIFEQALLLRGYEQFLVDLISNPEFASALLEKTTEIAIGMLTVGMQTCGKFIDILRLAGDDMGHQRGTIISPKAFRKMIKPHFSRLYGISKSMIEKFCPSARLMAHTDGDVYSLIPDYVEMGLDVLNPVQPLVTNMDHSRLKTEFGPRLSFHGGIDIQKLLPFGTPAEVMQQATTTMKVLGKEGGYIMAPTHYVQPDVPPENIIALRDAVRIHGNYPIQL